MNPDHTEDMKNLKKTIAVVCAVILLVIAGDLEDSFAGDTISGWTFKKSLPNNFKYYGFKIVSRSKGHPVRDGKRSMRFEVRAGDCSWSSGWSDCENDRERHELLTKHTWKSGEKWYHWSIFIPVNYPIIFPVKTALAQFHQEGSHPVWMFQNHTGGYVVDNQVYGSTRETKKILTDEEMRGKWSDVLVHARWTHKNKGFFRVYVNGETTPRYTWNGPTKSKGRAVYFKFGVYRSFMSRRPGKEPTQVVYYDEVKRANSCRKATKFFPCKEIDSLIKP